MAIIEVIGDQAEPVSFRPGNWFDDQFADRQHFETYGGHVTVVDIVPPNFEQQTDQTPVLFVPGFLANVDGFKLTMRVFANSGKRVIGMNHSNRRGVNSTNQPFHSAIVQKAEDVLTVVNELNLSSTDVVAHSEGLTVSMVSNKIAKESGHDVSPYRIVAGIGPHGFRSLDTQDVLRSPGMLVRSAREMIGHPNLIGIAASTAKLIGKNVLKIPSEGWALRTTTIIDYLPKADDYTEVGVLLLTRDEVIPPKKHYPIFENGAVISALSTVVSEHSHHVGILNDQKTIDEALIFFDGMRTARTVNRHEIAA